MRAEILKHVQRMTEDFADLLGQVEDKLDEINEKYAQCGIPNHEKAPTIADNLIMNYPNLPDQVREFLECIRDDKHYEQNVSNLSMVI